MGLLILSEVSTQTVFQLLAGFAVGGGAIWFWLRWQTHSYFRTRQQDANRLLEDARRRADEVIRAGEVETKANFLKQQQEFDAAGAQRREELREIEKRLERREDLLERKNETLSSKERSIEAGEARIKEQERAQAERTKQIDELLQQHRTQLLKITNLSFDEARRQLFQNLENDLEQEVAELVDKRLSEAQETAERRSREIVITAIQRYAAGHTADSTVSTVSVPSDDMKGRVIGREGRNIRAFEKVTGVDVIVDDTPGVVVVSCFDPVRREIARQSLEKLIQDGRIHPARIEEIVEQTREIVEKQIIELGKKASMDANLPGLNRKIIELLGRLAYRTSYGQNVLAHSVEVAFLCQIMAEELKLDGKLARRCGLLHDIGKAVDHEEEGGHPAIGARICEKLGEPPEVLNAIAGHHGDIPATSFYTPLVAAADAISAARPGGRRESLERYIKRLVELEGIATGFRGVEQAYAIQAGREVRVLVNAGEVDDANAVRIAREIAQRIEQEMTYPGEIRVTVLRETRAVEYAR